jgi:catechol 2,3-dioxygenase-like lactoylglutathione lyase family enzyme
MIKSIDHVVILVNDLEVAKADYSALGFTVVPGGEHTDGTTHNALVSFADGAYLELIAFKRENPQHRWWRYTTMGEGLVDFALLPGDIDQDVATARQRGLEYTGPIPGGRKRPDGQQIEWKIATPPTADLPFLCLDLTPRSWRVPDGPAWEHANGVVGIDSIMIGVKNLAASTEHYRALLGTRPHPGEYPTSAAPVGASGVILAEATPDSPLGEYVEKRGEGPYALVFRTKAGPPTPSILNLVLTHGVRMELV